MLRALLCPRIAYAQRIASSLTVCDHSMSPKSSTPARSWPPPGCGTRSMFSSLRSLWITLEGRLSSMGPTRDRYCRNMRSTIARRAGSVMQRVRLLIHPGRARSHGMSRRMAGWVNPSSAASNPPAAVPSRSRVPASAGRIVARGLPGSHVSTRMRYALPSSPSISATWPPPRVSTGRGHRVCPHASESRSMASFWKSSTGVSWPRLAIFTTYEPAAPVSTRRF